MTNLERFVIGHHFSKAILFVNGRVETP